MELFNAQTREREDINDQEALHQALLSGTHSYKAGEMIRVVNPDGEDKTIPAEKVPEAIQAGYIIKTGNQNAVDQYVAENRGIGGMAKVALTNLVDEGLMGAPEMIYEATGDPLEVAKREALKKEHELSSAVGNVGGFGASMFYGGPLFKGAAKVGQAAERLLAEKLMAKAGEELTKRSATKIARELAAKSTAKAVGHGVEGALVTSPIAVTEAMLGDHEAAAESLLAGVGIGSLFGVGGAMAGSFKKMATESKAVRELRGKLDDALKTDDVLKDKAAEHAFEVLDPKKHHLKRISSNEVIENELGEAISVARSRDTKAIGREMIEQGILDGMPNITDVAERLVKKTGELSDDIGKSFKSIDDLHGGRVNVDTAEVVSAIRKNVLPQLKKNKAIHSEVARFEKELDNLAGPKPVFGTDELAALDMGTLAGAAPDVSPNLLSLTDANTLKSQYQKQIGDMAITEGKTFKELLNEIPKEINRQIREKIGTIDKVALDDLVRKQKTLGNLKAAEKIAVDRAQAAVANNNIGLTSFITGIGGAAAFDGGLSLLAGAALGGAREFTRRHGDLLASKAYDKFAGLLFAEQAMKRSAEKIDEIPKILKRMSTGAKITKTASIPVLARLFGDDTRKPQKSAEIQPKPLPQPIMPARPRQLKRANEDIGDLVSNPERAIEKLEEIISPIAQGGAPGVGAVLSANMAKSLQYLHSVMPKPPRMPSPFAPKVLWQPSDYEMTVFEQKMSVVADPFHVMDQLEAGTLTKNHMEALKVCYPKLHEAMVTKIYKSVAEIEDPIPYADRVKLSVLIEQPLDIFMQPAEMAKLQQSFAVIDQPEQAPATGGGPQINIAQGMQSQGQRLLARGG